MLANNQRINWLPEHIRDGRFGNFLETNVDWALSRERYWGTPLPIWVCDQTGQMEAIAGYDELLAKPEVQGTEVWEQAQAANPELPDDLKVHKPYIDAVTYASPFAAGGGCGASGSDRLLVRLRRDAVRPVGLSATGPRAFERSFRPTSSAKRSTRRAAGSTACWRSAPCCSAMRIPTGPTPRSTRSRTPSRRASCSADAGRMVGERRRRSGF
jgi:hypothetical protein